MTTTHRTLTPAQVLALFGEQLRLARFNMVGNPDHHCADERQLMRDKHGLAHLEAAAREYNDRLLAKAKEIRIAAFDATVAKLARTIHTEDINMILPVLRKAGLRYENGDVYIVHDGQNLPAVWEDYHMAFAPMRAALLKAAA